MPLSAGAVWRDGEVNTIDEDSIRSSVSSVYLPARSHSIMTDESQANSPSGEDHDPSTALPQSWVGPPVTRTGSSPSFQTVITVGPGALNLSELRATIGEHDSLQRATISYTELYTAWTGRVIHRFLILELNRERKQPFWIRLDRRPGGSLLQRLRIIRLGSTPTRDEAQLRTDKAALVGSAKRENHQLFRSAPTLAEFSILLDAISLEVKNYTLWPENCYFFCSLIQEQLGKEHGGFFADGSLPHPDLAVVVRRKVLARMGLISELHSRIPFGELLDSLAAEVGWPSAQLALDAAQKLKKSRPFFLRFFGFLSQRAEQVFVLCKSIGEIGYFLRSRQKGQIALAIYAEFHGFLRGLDDWHRLNSEKVAADRRSLYRAFLFEYATALNVAAQNSRAMQTEIEQLRLARQLDAIDPQNYRWGLARALASYSGGLRRGGQLEEAYNASAESVFLSRQTFVWDPDGNRHEFAYNLQYYGDVLRELRRFEEACDIYAELVPLRRQMCATDNNMYRPAEFASTLHFYAHCLRETGQYDEACVAAAEGIDVTRSLLALDSEIYGADLSTSLHNYSIYLRETGRYNEGCDAGAEAVAIMRQLCPINPNHYIARLQGCLRMHGTGLREAGRLDEACAAGAEATALARRLYASDADRYRVPLTKALGEYSESLQKAGRVEEAGEVMGEEREVTNTLSLGTP